jgi:hypothetical protein
MKQWTDEQWREHEKKFEGINLENLVASNYSDYLKETESQIEHPEWYESPCLCRLCCSYGD